MCVDREAEATARSFVRGLRLKHAVVAFAEGEGDLPRFPVKLGCMGFVVLDAHLRFVTTRTQPSLSSAGYAGLEVAEATLRRAAAQAMKVRCLPEEPLRNACVGRMSVSDNIAFRTFDRDASGSKLRLLDKKRMRERAEDLIAAYSIKTQGPLAPIQTLSGGNVQRAVLARELAGETDLLVAANPCFGLDFGAVADIRAQLIAARNRGTAVLLVSEDLDEIVALSDRICVMFEGCIVFECAGGEAVDTTLIGTHMAGHH